VGPDLIRSAGRHSNDWHLAHLYDPRAVAPYSVMPPYPWFFDEERRPTRRALALVAYLQWLGSWIPEAERPGGTD
jgi:cbb3-type cytochrome oxidase cytochrome c subunit